MGIRLAKAFRSYASIHFTDAVHPCGAIFLSPPLAYRSLATNIRRLPGLLTSGTTPRDVSYRRIEGLPTRLTWCQMIRFFCFRPAPAALVPDKVGRFSTPDRVRLRPAHPSTGDAAHWTDARIQVVRQRSGHDQRIRAKICSMVASTRP